jgi:hypothetical protein
MGFYEVGQPTNEEKIGAGAFIAGAVLAPATALTAGGFLLITAMGNDHAGGGHNDAQARIGMGLLGDAAVGKAIGVLGGLGGAKAADMPSPSSTLADEADDIAQVAQKTESAGGSRVFYGEQSRDGE